MKIKLAIMAATVVSVFSVSAMAAPVFSDNFDADTLATNQTTFNGGWVVSGGTVDLIGNPAFYDFLPGNGRYVDLDGSSSQAGEFHKDLSLTGGLQYILAFDLAGSQRGSVENVNVNFGSAVDNLTVNSGDGFSNHTLLFSPSTTGIYSLIFQNAGGDNVGALLDNVSVSAVPEPETYAMLLVGLGLLGFMARRRKESAV
ncbi:PEP motif putative anchor domain protein [Nitrosomonas sp. Is79A3]|uniref:FxDxF family PEP-CTERM protein n=1 Tax=Nitrosomonas sp. (strain Is79A3) TaxID=261292 RepID=UPI000215D260